MRTRPLYLGSFFTGGPIPAHGLGAGTYRAPISSTVIQGQPLSTQCELWHTQGGGPADQETTCMPPDSWWDIQPTGDPARDQVIAQNKATLWSEAWNYPYPQPIQTFLARFLIQAQPDLRQMVQAPSVLDPDNVDVWFTLEVLAQYNAVVDFLQNEMNKIQKDEAYAKRLALEKAITVAVVGAIMSFVMPAILITAIQTIPAAYATHQSTENALKNLAMMKDAGQVFKDTDAQFSDKINHAMAVMSSQVPGSQSLLTPSTPPLMNLAAGAGAAVAGFGILAIILKR